MSGETMSEPNESKILLAQKTKGAVTAHYVASLSAVIMVVMLVSMEGMKNIDSTVALVLLFFSFVAVWGVIGAFILKRTQPEPYRYVQDTDPLRNVRWTSY